MPTEKLNTKVGEHPSQEKRRGEEGGRGAKILMIKMPLVSKIFSLQQTK